MPLPEASRLPKLIDMRKLLTSTLLIGCLFASCCAPVHGQEMKDEAPPPTTAPRDGPTIPYLLAGIGLLLVMVLVCMPARRD